MDAALVNAAQLFKVLSNTSRLALLVLLSDEQRTVGALERAAGMSQPLVSQHLRTLRQAGLVTAMRIGKEMHYRVADQHVTHVVSDAIAHARENVGAAITKVDPTTKKKGDTMTSTETHAEHSIAEHEHATDCGHETVTHDDHIDFVHDGHKHALHGDHYDEH